MTDLLDRPVLVGGTGRSGSTIVGHLLDHHPDLTLTRPMEVRFITGNDGLADALAIAQRKPGSAKAMSAARLAVDRILHRWYQRTPDVGLHTSLSHEEISELCERYLEAFAVDPLSATRQLTRAVMAKVAAKIDATRWVDTTPANARKAQRVEPIYPESTVIVVHRDGRDVAASFVHQSFGPDDVFEALAQWGQRMLRIHQSVRESRPGRVLEIDLVDLVDKDRLGTAEEICTAVGVSTDPSMMAWFEENVTSAGAHHGRWRHDFDADACARIDEDYLSICERLLAEGVRIPSAG